MKKSTVLLALSVALNTAFAAAFFLRPVAPAGRAERAATSVAEKPASSPAGSLTAVQLAAIQSGDAEQMKAAGLPDDIARTLAAGRAFANLQARIRALTKPVDPNSKYWRNANSPYNYTNRTKEERAEMAKAQREFTDALRSAFGPDASPYAYVDTRYSFLPPAKREQLMRVEQDYGEMQNEIYIDANGVQLPSDREKLKLLMQEKERDLASIMTPQEYERYTLQSSQTANNIRSRFGEGIQTEEDYKKVFALQKAYDDQYNIQFMIMGPQSQAMMTARREADVKLQEDIKAALGPENFAAIQKAADQDYKALTSVAKRLNLPPESADTVFASRDTYADASQRINADTSLTAADRRAQLIALATQAKTELAKTLGTEGAEAYAARAGWMSMLNSGTAFSTNVKDAPAGRPNPLGSSVYPMQPPRPAGPAAPATGAPVRN